MHSVVNAYAVSVYPIGHFCPKHSSFMTQQEEAYKLLMRKLQRMGEGESALILFPENYTYIKNITQLKQLVWRLTTINTTQMF